MTGLLWSIALAALGIAGIWLAGNRSSLGWALGLAAQLLWIVFAIATHQYGFILSAVAYGFVYGRNLRRWKLPRRWKLRRWTLTMRGEHR